MKYSLQEVTKIIKANEAHIKGYGVKEIYIFGSVARGEAKETSDIDIFVEFGPDGADYFTLIDLEEFLTEKLKTRVDLGTKRSLHPLMRDQILREAVRVA